MQKVESQIWSTGANLHQTRVNGELNHCMCRYRGCIRSLESNSRVKFVILGGSHFIIVFFGTLASCTRLHLPFLLLLGPNPCQGISCLYTGPSSSFDLCGPCERGENWVR